MSGEKSEILRITAKIDENRKVVVYRVPCEIPEPTVMFEFWNGSCRTQLRLSDEAFSAAIQAYQTLMADPTEMSA